MKYLLIIAVTMLIIMYHSSSIAEQRCLDLGNSPIQCARVYE